MDVDPHWINENSPRIGWLVTSVKLKQLTKADWIEARWLFEMWWVNWRNTSAIFEAEVGETPNVSETDGDADAGEEEIQLMGPSSAFLNIILAIFQLFVGTDGSFWLFNSLITLLYIPGRGFNFLQTGCNSFRFRWVTKNERINKDQLFLFIFPLVSWCRPWPTLTFSLCFVFSACFQLELEETLG